MEKSAYRLDIQGLRAVAVLAVMLFHYDGTLLPGGYVGVDIFLVISGYLITQQFQSRNNANYQSPIATLAGFYFSRAKRIFPAYFFMLAIVAILAKLLFTNSDFAYFLSSLKSTAVFISNGYFANFGDYFAPELAEQPLLHTWSLAVEMQFYLLFPILLLLVPGRHIKPALLVISITLILAAEWQLRVAGHRQATYYALYSRIPEFLAGSWLAMAATGREWSKSTANIAFVVGSMLIAFSLLMLDGASPFPGLLSVPAIIGSGLLISARQSSISVGLRNPLMVWIGFLSYSLYLWHWPVLAIIRYYSGSSSLEPRATIVFALATLILACLSFYLIEEPARKMRFGAVSRRRALAVLLMVGIGSLGAYRAALAAKDYLGSSGLSAEYTRYADPATICHGVDNGHCVKGDLDSVRNILVIGDSHAAMMNGFFDQLGKEQGFKATVLTASSCVPIPGFNVAKLPEWAQQSCLDQIRRVEELAAKADILFIAGMWSYQVEDSLFTPALTRFVQTTGAERPVYLLSQVPALSKNPMRMHRFAGMGLPLQVPFDPAYRQANEAIAKAAKQGGASFLALDDLEIFREAPYLDGQLIYMDESHLNQVGVDAYAHAARAEIHELVSSGGR